MTLLRPALAQELLVTPARGGVSTVHLTVTGGQTVTVPAGRLRSIRVGSLIVEDLDVAIYDAMPARQDVQGLLGGDFLRNFQSYPRPGSQAPHSRSALRLDRPAP